MKLNKPIAGYHLLMILSAVDNEFSFNEDNIIAEYICEQFPIAVNLDRETEFLASLPKEEYMKHFKKAMADFYSDSTEKERLDLLNFAVRLVKASEPVTKEENVYLNELFNEWTETAI
ncbi:MAG: hypothetical protein RMJ53_04900 [Chitinophagales bacterium]|nr:hypothetical protein [Chitinophagales bacterium]MDW8273551.1 hypothetical protein [Chitinophagales bacterium]